MSLGSNGNGSLPRWRLKLHQVLHEASEAIKSVYFLNNGLGSVLTVLPDGKSVEVGLIGKEGFIGLPVVFGFKTSPFGSFCQTPTGWTCNPYGKFCLIV